MWEGRGPEKGDRVVSRGCPKKKGEERGLQVYPVTAPRGLARVGAGAATPRSVCIVRGHTPCPRMEPQGAQQSESSSSSSPSPSRKRGFDDSDGERLRLGTCAPSSRAPASPPWRWGSRGGGGGIAAADATLARVASGVSAPGGAGPDCPPADIRLSRVAAVAANDTVAARPGGSGPLVGGTSSGAGGKATALSRARPSEPSQGRHWALQCKLHW